MSDKPLTLPGANIYITTCRHGLDLRVHPHCYLCQPEDTRTAEPGGLRAIAESYLTPLEHLPTRRVGDPDDIPRCIGCGILLRPERGHRQDCAVAAYLAALAARDG
jgi:hypothetical protein